MQEEKRGDGSPSYRDTIIVSLWRQTDLSNMTHHTAMEKQFWGRLLAGSSDGCDESEPWHMCFI